MKYTFKCELDDPPFSVEMKCEHDYIGDVVENFELFLRGVGFHQGSINDYLHKDEINYE